MTNICHNVESTRDDVGAAAWALLANAFRYPDEDWRDVIANRDRWEGFRCNGVLLGAETAAALAALCDASMAFAATACGCACVAGVAGAAAPEDRALTVLQADYSRLFSHTVRGACPPYEYEYGRRDIVQQSAELADVTGFYTAFGMEVAGYAHERADHVSAECEFLAVLSAKAAQAIRAGDEAGLEVLNHARAAFLSDHAGRWLPSFGRRLRRAAADGFYARAADFLLSFVDAECRRQSVEPAAAVLPLAPADPATDGAIECGVEESCPGAGQDERVQLSVGGVTLR